MSEQEENGGGDAGQGGAPSEVAAPPGQGGRSRRGVSWEDKLWVEMTAAERADWLRRVRDGRW